jgi:uncharacterized protein
MQASMFNVRVPLEDRDEFFLLNTLTDAQLIVSREVSDLLDRLGSAAFASLPPTAEEREAISTLAENGFIVDSRETDRRNIEQYFDSFRANSDQLRVTLLTTLQCNFACDYCLQGDHGDWNKTAAKMSMDTAARLGNWIEARLEALGSKGLALVFFGGEPLLNMPVVDYLSQRMWAYCQARGISMYSSIVTNGLLLTPEIVDRLTPYGLGGVKITLDGDRDTHNRMRPLRGGQGTFDKILKNIRLVADKVKVSIGGNFDESSVDSYPALIEYLREQDFADKLQKVSFKPIIREQKPPQPKGFIALTPIASDGTPTKPLGGSCMTSAGAGVTNNNSGCDTCGFLDEKTAFLREETMKAGFKTVDGVHMGPCDIHKSHSYTVGPDGSLYACPGFATELGESTGHIDGRRDDLRTAAAKRFEKILGWHECNDCSFIPVCAGGCSAASHVELGDMNKPNCHKPSFEAGAISLAHRAARELVTA